nr:hypothetical protein BaRGS_027900 [Batillaria attramentaria]
MRTGPLTTIGLLAYMQDEFESDPDDVSESRGSFQSHRQEDHENHPDGVLDFLGPSQFHSQKDDESQLQDVSGSRRLSRLHKTPSHEERENIQRHRRGSLIHSSATALGTSYALRDTVPIAEMPFNFSQTMYCQSDAESGRLAKPVNQAYRQDKTALSGANETGSPSNLKTRIRLLWKLPRMTLSLASKRGDGEDDRTDPSMVGILAAPGLAVAYKKLLEDHENPLPLSFLLE